MGLRADRFVRLHPAEDDPEALLRPEEQRAEPWGGTIYGRCDKCGGSGETEHECESCKQGPPRDDCPACQGRVSYRGECPACEGSGEIDADEGAVLVKPSRIVDVREPDREAIERLRASS